MKTLVEFLAARIDEDEAVARGAAESAEGFTSGEARGCDWYAIDAGIDAGLMIFEQVGTATPDDDDTTPITRYIAHYDPARVLAEVTAKRVTLTFCAQVIEDDEGLTLYSDGHGGLRVAQTVLADMAAVYSDHPDYREEWV